LGSAEVARLDYVAPGSSEEADRLYEQVQRLGRPLLNLYAELANHPPALGAFLVMSNYVRDRSTLEDGIRELSILATAYALGQEYEIAQHTKLARRAGLSEAKIKAVRAGSSVEGLTEHERCAVEYAQEAATSRTCSDATFAQMRRLFSVEQVVDLIVTAAWYHLCAILLGSLQIDIEETG
jgi:4-carboxymuconolactone decarboxylase